MSALRLLFFASLLGAAACTAAHVLTFADIAFYPILIFVPLVFVICVLLVFQFRRIPRKNLLSEIFGNVPSWMKLGAVLLFAYAFINLFLCIRLNEGANPVRISETHLALKNADKIIRDLTPAEFRHAQAVQVRLLTGHLVLIYALAAFAAYSCWLKSGPAMANARIR